MAPRPISDSTFTIVANGFADGPAQALRDFLVERSAQRVTTIFHPLVDEGDVGHIFTTYENGRVTTRRRRLPFYPPLTFLLDPLLPLRISRSDAWFGFNNLACLRGLVRRRFGRSRHVYYWCVDFVPDRFGRSVATLAYEALDRLVSSKVDVRLELSAAAAEARDRRFGKKDELPPALVVPMGAWIDRVPVTDSKVPSVHSLVYLGHLVERQGVPTLIRTVAELRNRGRDVRAQVIGRGPQEGELRALASELQVGEQISFRGFVEDHREVEKILASSSIAVAPYIEDPASFTRYADPGKLKAYLAAGLPIVMTPVPPNAQELADSGAAVLVKSSAEGFAGAVDRFIQNPDLWESARANALKYSESFDWNRILPKTLGRLGFS